MLSLTEKQLGILLVSGALGALMLTPWTLAPLLLVLWLSPRIRGLALETVDSGLRERDGLLLRILVVAAPLAYYMLYSPYPPDDLLRDMTANLHQFDYRNLYWGSPRLMRGDISYWFSRAVDWLPRVLPQQYAYLPVCYALEAGWALVIPLTLRKAFLHRNPDLPPAQLWALVAVLSVLVWAQLGFVSRIVQARPENFGALLALSAFLVEGVWGELAWGAAMLAFIPMYWLSGIYIPAVLLLRRSGARRAAWFLVLAGAFAAFWMSGAGGHWWHWFFGMRVAIAHRMAPVAEDLPLRQVLFTPWIYLFAIFAMVFWRRPGERQGELPTAKAHAFAVGSASISTQVVVFGLLCWFALPDMLRYVDDLAPLLAVWLALNSSPARLRWADTAVFRLLAFCLVLFMAGGLVPHTGNLPRLEIPGAKPGARVLTSFGPAEYVALYENPQLRFTPAMELGYTRRALQTLSLDLNTGKATCAALHRYRVSWVVAHDVAYPGDGLSACLRLDRSDVHGFQIWRVYSPKASTRMSVQHRGAVHRRGVPHG